MKFRKPDFWQEKNHLLSYLLLPITLIINLLSLAKNLFIKGIKYKIPIVCVGNIYIGGTGKTPLSILLAIELSKMGKKPAIIKKFYSDHSDEHELIKNYCDCLFINKSRSKAIELAELENKDLAILDDGYQDPRIQKDLNILCFNSNQKIGNEMTIPSGPLRESMNSIKRAQIILINGEKDIKLEEKIFGITKEISIFYSKYRPLNINEFEEKKLFAFAGIGNPENFFNLLKMHNLKVIKQKSFPDHYQFNKVEIKKLIEYSNKENLQIITTEKDYYRIKKLGFEEIKFLKIALQIEKKEKLLNKIINLIK